MKRLYILGVLLLTVAVHTFAQSTQIFNLSKLAKQDTLLSGWKFQPGDNAQWAQPGFDDSKWDAADPGEDIQSFSKLKKSGVGWIRLHITVDTAIAGPQLAAWVSQYTASEIYLNGRLLGKYGTVSSTPAKVVAYLPSREPFYLQLKPGAGNVIAVRLAYQPGLPYVSNFFVALPAYSMHLNSYQAALANYREYQQNLNLFIITYSLSAGILLIISIVYMAYFLFDRNKKVNLYYSLLTLMLFINAAPNEIWGINRFGPVLGEMWVFFIGGAVLVPGMLFMLMTVYSLFNYPRRAVFRLLLFIGVVLAVGMYFIGTNGYLVINDIFPVLCLLEGAYVCAWAIKRKKKDAAIILAGIFLFTVFSVSSSLISQDRVLAQLLFYGGLIWFPVGMSFYLGVQSALTNKKLTRTLDEVQTLSAQNLAQEQEKQLILSRQNETLEQQVADRTAELKQSFDDLKATQTQLIQSEKMASLGELIAGIAHEIQNPLNFVNNFSEVNQEMIDEMEMELKAGNIEEALAIAADIKQNEEKINHHGKRADGIVKGMLEHSRTSAGEKQLTNINTLADEFFKLSYHGLRAKDKTFNAELITNFDDNLPKVNVIPQDIGRVMLNLFNNAFYAVNQKSKTAGEGYKAEVSVSTALENGQVIIIVKDNGIGIPDTIKEKIMQPFFTTKPTGEGTGLGLSLTYDMVVKGHGGSITVNSVAGEGSEFIISLPIKKI